MTTVRKITAVVINYNGISTVIETIRSLYAMRDVACEIVVIDDGSLDGSPDAIQKVFPEIRIEQEPRNTRLVNRLRNKGLSLATSSQVLLTDNDVRFHPDCGIEMLTAMAKDRLVAACIPRLMFMDDERRICQTGGQVHYVGATIAPDRGSLYEHRDLIPRIAVGGGVALFDMEKLRHVGLFDENYALAWGDDGELHQRLLLSGYKCLYVPTAVGYHEYKAFGPTRHYRARGHISNRWRYMLTHYSLRTLMLIIPMLLMYECIEALYYLLNGIPHLYAVGTIDTVTSWRAIRQRRKEIQRLRVVSDDTILFAGPLHVRPGTGVVGAQTARIAQMISAILSAYWRLIQPFLVGGETESFKTGHVKNESANLNRTP